MDLISRDLKSVWHPCSQMKDYETFLPLVIRRAKGVYLELENGQRILDAISSWWCKSLGHGHPKLKAALSKQIKKFEHVILANTTNEVIVSLSEQLLGLTSHKLEKIFFASEGSSAVEIALKMSLQARMNNRQSQKNQFVALKNAYHGETLLALAVSDLGLYKRPFESIIPKIHFIKNIPYVSSINKLTPNNNIKEWNNICSYLSNLKENLTAIIVEPIVQGSAGMLVYDPNFLTLLGKWCAENDVHLIADEIMTGFARTGRMFAYQHSCVEPDFLCVGKGLTAGCLPMSAVLVKENIYRSFYDDYEQGTSFLHSHTYSGNGLAAAVALEAVKIYQQESFDLRAQELEKIMSGLMHDVSEATKKIINIRYIGGIVAADLKENGSSNRRLGYLVFQKAVELGALLRPLGNTLYWFPPLNIKTKDLFRLRDITIKAIKESNI